MNHPRMFVDRDNKVKLMPASFFTGYNSYERKINFNLKKFIKLIKLFYLLCSCKRVIENSN